MPTPTNSTQNDIPAWKKQGAWGFFDETEGSEEKEERKKETPKFDIKASIPFNTVSEKVVETAKDTIVDAFGEAFDLGKYIFTGDSEAIGVEVKAEAPEHHKEPANSDVIAEIQLWLNELKQSQSLEDYKNKANNAMRLLDGATSVSSDEAQGYLDKESIATLMGVANKRAEIKEQVVEQKKEQSVAQTNPGALGENALLKSEGNGGAYGTSGDASLG